MLTPDMSVWTGRVDTADGPEALRWHQRVQPLTPGCPPGFVLIGFVCEAGMVRNQGRVGCSAGPRAIRAALTNLAWQPMPPIYDAGDVVCDGDELEAAQAQLAQVVGELIQAGHRPIVLGGGHEAAWGTFQGVTSSLNQTAPAIVNFDAHFDLRGDARASAGTPFAQMARWCQERSQPFRYACLGIAEANNTVGLFSRANQLGVVTVRDESLLPWDLAPARAVLDAFADTTRDLYISLDLDVLPAATMPAVSAPAPRGVALETIEALLAQLLATGKVRAVDVVELNPTYDADSRGARIAARLVWWITRHWNLTAEDWA